MQKNLNLKIKYRESFRPFAPSVLREDVADYFEFDGDSHWRASGHRKIADALLPHLKEMLKLGAL